MKDFFLIFGIRMARVADFSRETENYVRSTDS